MSRRYAVNLFKTGDTAHDFQQAGAEQVIEPFLAALVTNLNRVAFFHNNTGDAVGNFNDFINPDTTLVTVVALFATDRPVNGKPGLDVVFSKAHLDQRLFGDIHGLLAV